MVAPLESTPKSTSTNKKIWVIGDIQGCQHLVAGLFDDPRTWVMSLVNPVAKADQPKRICRILGPGDIFVIVPAFRMDLGKHLHHRLIGPAMQRSPQGIYSCGDRGVEVHPGTASYTHRSGGTVLFMIPVQD